MIIIVGLLILLFLVFVYGLLKIGPQSDKLMSEKIKEMIEDNKNG